MAIAVVDGAMLQCTCGASPMPLKVTSQMACKIDGKLAATIADHAPTVNIKPFGACATLQGPCVPATATPWAPGSTSTVMIGGIPALLNSDKLTCTVGGMISITDPGQQKTQDT
jgi:Domain of unknown function (DUF4280)